MVWIEARDEHGKLWFRYDPARELVEVGQRGVRRVFDLRALHGAAGSQGVNEAPHEDAANTSTLLGLATVDMT